METIFIEKLTEFRREKKFLEKELGLKLTLNGKKLTISGTPLQEYEASNIIKAMNFGFPARVATLIKDEDFMFQIINIKDHTRKKNLEEVRARIIGKHGKTKKTLEEISGCKIIIKESEIGIIGNAEEMQYAITAISNIARGTKQSNAYKYLEKINRNRNKKN